MSDQQTPVGAGGSPPSSSGAGPAAHTPGPWEVYLSGRVELNNLQWLVTCVDDGAGEDVPIICEASHGEADARLIAAAPELLEALKAAIREQFNGLEDGDALPAWCDRAYSAIAKAEGRA